MPADAASRAIEELQLDERDVHRLLERAAMIDEERAAATTVAELRRVAEEAGISSEAFSQALREFQRSLPEHLPSVAMRSDEEPQGVSAWLEQAGNRFMTTHGWGRAGTLALGGFALGGLVRFFGEYGLHNLVALLAVAMFSMSLSIDNGRRGTQGAYQVELLHTWFGFGVGWSFLNGGVLDGMATVTGGLWLGLAVGGGLLVALLKRISGGSTR